MSTRLVDGMQYGNFKDGAIIALLAIVMVFLILLLIIVLTDLVSRIAAKTENKAAESAALTTNSANETSPLNLNDEDALVASLVASIDYHNITKKHIQVLNVREVK